MIQTRSYVPAVQVWYGIYIGVHLSHPFLRSAVPSRYFGVKTPSQLNDGNVADHRKGCVVFMLLSSRNTVFNEH